LISTYELGVESHKGLRLIITDHPVSPSLFTREGIDTINSISWLVMDALWMFNLPKVGLLFGIPALLTGIILFYRERNQASNWINLATICWITMNIFWMLSDTFPSPDANFLLASKGALALGIIFVGIGAHHTGSVTGAIAHYKRYKTLGDRKLRSLD
jgi:hypothetical protein